jgi:transmembrane sensor
MNAKAAVIREEAAAWFARRRDSACAPGDEAAFEAWRGRSEAHARAYAETERAWAQWGRLRDSARMREMTAAAMATTAAGPRRPDRRRWQPLPAAACLAAVAVAVFAGIHAWLLATQAQPVVYRTRLGEQRSEQLPDGTRVVLNTQTLLQVQYGARQRKVTLQHGEAMFEVVHDAGRPFVVVAGDGSVTDLGTRFQVRDENGIAAITLLEGRVEVATHGEREPLVPGEQASYGIGTAGIRVRRVDTATMTSWTRGRLDFSGLPLGQAVSEANRYCAVKLRLGDPRLASMPVGGSFRAGDNAAIATALSAVFPLRIAHGDAHEIVLMPR